eukprot:gene31874-7083_t
MLEELDMLDSADLSNVEYMPAYLNKRLNNRLLQGRRKLIWYDDLKHLWYNDQELIYYDDLEVVRYDDLEHMSTSDIAAWCLSDTMARSLFHVIAFADGGRRCWLGTMVES